MVSCHGRNRNPLHFHGGSGECKPKQGCHTAPLLGWLQVRGPPGRKGTGSPAPLWRGLDRRGVLGSWTGSHPALKEPRPAPRPAPSLSSGTSTSSHYNAPWPRLETSQCARGGWGSGCGHLCEVGGRPSSLPLRTVASCQGSTSGTAPVSMPAVSPLPASLSLASRRGSSGHLGPGLRQAWQLLFSCFWGSGATM